MTSILLVEDEPSLADSVRYNLEREGFVVRVATDGPEGLIEFDKSEPDLVLLDLMLPGMSGLDLCKHIRSRSAVPIIMVTAKDSESDKVVGLELGADDYVTKPFSMRELISRVRAQLRRAEMPRRVAPSEAIRIGDVALDAERHEVKVRGELVPMTPKEFMLLEILMDRSGKLVTRDLLIEEVWGPEFYGETKTLDVHIRRLREKIEPDPKHPRMLLTVRGLGYKFVSQLS